MDAQKLAKGIFGTLSHEIRTALVPLAQSIEKIENGGQLTLKEISEMRQCQHSIEHALSKLGHFVNAGFSGVSVQSDKMGLCHYLVKSPTSREKLPSSNV